MIRLCADIFLSDYGCSGIEGIYGLLAMRVEFTFLGGWTGKNCGGRGALVSTFSVSVVHGIGKLQGQ